MLEEKTSTEQDSAIGSNERNLNSCIWGDEMNVKDDNTIRMMFQNINGFINIRSEHKSESIREIIANNQVDVMAMAEMNANWRVLTKRHQLQQRCRGWFEHQHLTKAYNYRDRSCHRYQPGGTAIICRDEMGMRWINSEGDKRGLGRWSSMCFRGKDQLKLRIVSVYVPTIPQDYGTKKTYYQQQRALLSMGITTNPLTVFWNDLWTMIDTFLDKGEKIVLSGDWNTDVREDEFLLPFRQRNLIPAIISKHGEKAPATYARGSKPIDEIFISESLDIQSCGYLTHGESLGDHRPIWVDLNKESALGAKLPPIPSFKARRLKCKDPRIVERYNMLLEKYLKKNSI